eukprot:2097385-Rhodomonas_salina.1
MVLLLRWLFLASASACLRMPARGKRPDAARADAARSVPTGQEGEALEHQLLHQPDAPVRAKRQQANVGTGPPALARQLPSSCNGASDMRCA